MYDLPISKAVSVINDKSKIISLFSLDNVYNIIYKVNCRKSDYVPVNSRRIYGRTEEKCKYFRLDANCDFLSFCINKKMCNIVGINHWWNTDLGLECSKENCKFYLDDEKKKILWMNKNDLKEISNCNVVNDIYNKYSEVVQGHQIVYAYINNEWRKTYYFNVKIYELPWMTIANMEEINGKS